MNFDQYDIEAVLIPSLYCILMVFISIIPFVHSSALYYNINSLSSYIILCAIALIGISLTMKITRTFSKTIVEQVLFGWDNEHMPTTDYLMLTKDYGNDIIRDRVRAKVKEDFFITLKSRTFEEKDEVAARKAISGAVSLIKKKVQSSSEAMYKRKNKRYGSTRNFIGASLLSAIVSAVCIALTYVCHVETIYSVLPVIVLIVSICVALYLLFIYKGIAKEYANELFETYLTISQ